MTTVEGFSVRLIRVQPREWPTFSGHLTAECATKLDGGPACPACLAHRLRSQR